MSPGVEAGNLEPSPRSVHLSEFERSERAAGRPKNRTYREDKSMTDLPRIISVDDHIVEPPNLWADRLPSKYLDRGPRVERHYGYLDWDTGGKMEFVDDDRRESAKSRWCDHWVYDDLRWPVPAGYAALGPTRGLEAMTPISYDEML